MKNIIKHPLFAGSMVMIIGNNFVNFLSFVYTLLMGRLLGPVDYGTFASLLSLVGLVSMIPFSLGMVIIKFISAAKSEDEAKTLINWFNKKIVHFSILAESSRIRLSKKTTRLSNRIFGIWPSFLPRR